MNSLMQGFAAPDNRQGLVGQVRTTKGSSFYFNKRGAGTCEMILDDKYIVYVFEPDRDPEPWFREILLCAADSVMGERPEVTAEVPEITYRINKVQDDQYGKDDLLPLKASPLPLSEQTLVMQDFVAQMRKNQFTIHAPETQKQDPVKEWVENPENTGKCDQRPRGRKDPDLMALVRVAARRAGYVDDTPSASYSPFINAVLWQAAEEGLLFRVRHAIIHGKGGDAHYTND